MKTALITGATDGIGRHTAKLLAANGYRVIIHGRALDRLEATKQEINKDVHTYCADFASLSQVRDFAEQVKRDHPHIDVLINNAGVFSQSKQQTEDGFELTWQVNVISQFLLTNLLVNNIHARIVNVASISAASSIDLDNLHQEHGGYSAHAAYSQSKIAMQMFTYALARRLEEGGSSVTANCLDPGTVNTKSWGPCGIDVADANDEYHLATHPSLDGISGKYFVYQQQRSSSGVSLDVEKQERLWSILEKQAGVVWRGVGVGHATAGSA